MFPARAMRMSSVELRHSRSLVVTKYIPAMKRHVNFNLQHKRIQRFSTYSPGTSDNFIILLGISHFKEVVRRFLA